MATFQSKTKTLANFILFLAGCLLVVVTVCMLVVITGRYIGFSTAWADEVARIAFVWCASLGAVSGIYKGLHFSVVQFQSIKNNSKRRALESVSILIMLGLSLVLSWSTIHSIPVAAMSILPAIGVSNAWFHAAITVFGVLSALFLAFRLVEVWKKPTN